ADARADALRQFSPEQCAELASAWQRIPAGALLPREAFPQDNIRQFRLTLHKHGIVWEFPLAAHIRGPGGSAILGGTSTQLHEVNDVERAMLTTIADFASVALH
ncbi:MAG TPA: hypothetical protein VE591_09735, partial [Candidatus Acidoferrum sp.]|nr:hypothetical protein [Candidatus Acidoferrum sp.]